MAGFAVPDGVLARQLEDETVILDTVSGSFFRLNNTGALVWSALPTAEGVDDLVQRLTATFDVGPEEARQDVLGLLDSLEARGLVCISR